MRRTSLSFAPLLLSSALLACLPACKQQAAEPPASRDASTPAPSAAAPVSMPITIDPRAVVIASMEKFMQVSSYRASMQFSGGPRGGVTGTVDFVAPDRFRMQMDGMPGQTVIGDTMYVSVGGRSMQVPMPAGTTTQWRDPGNFQETKAGMTVESLGAESVDGISAQKYVAHHPEPQPADVTMWIGPDDLPVKMEVRGTSNGQQLTTTVRYSRFNDPSLVIEAP